MPKIGIVGNFSFNKEAKGGQTIRTRIVSEDLIRRFGEEEVLCIDTDGWKKNRLKLLWNCIKISILCKNIIILPAHNGIRIFIPLFIILKFLFNKRLHYIVVGGWLADDLKKNKFLLNFSRKIDYVYVQTNTLRKKLKDMSISKNIFILPNFKLDEPLKHNKLITELSIPSKVCMVSRVNQEKGVEDAIEIVKRINKSSGRVKVILDIYGPIENEYEERFYSVIHEHTDCISYKGSINYNEIINVLSKYYLLLFPTKYYTEGFPGTIIDGLLAGVPVVASRWESYDDIIKDGVTGITYEFGDNNDFYSKLDYLLNNPKVVESMKKESLNEAKKYTADYAMENLINKLK
ncbi:glycosyltransferase family 4 protein [Lederbergia panacisoli]|uniref:glycosyltransferase family 4 protein n=1 Tax=Lederbergia panacisoli TaxID=1255251 RepID=UPI00214BED77|nr:glycosyltransferase family 4 protein [Lederbergia panacisoli]MCR2823817.1 glycosyltransferase family 4 protein [Lederbergia panacisoli]